MRSTNQWRGLQVTEKEERLTEKLITSRSETLIEASRGVILDLRLSEQMSLNHGHPKLLVSLIISLFQNLNLGKIW
jgi:hypothetical protein